MIGDITESFLIAAKSIGRVSIDIETTGLEFDSCEVALIQLWIPSEIILVRPHSYKLPFSEALLGDAKVEKLFHHAMFDLRFLVFHFNFAVENVPCTKVMSKILSPNRNKHSLKLLLEEHLGIEISKALQISDWSKSALSSEQIAYAVNDVAHLSSLYDSLQIQLKELPKACFAHIPTRVELDLKRYEDVFSY